MYDLNVFFVILRWIWFLIYKYRVRAYWVWVLVLSYTLFCL